MYRVLCFALLLSYLGDDHMIAVQGHTPCFLDEEASLHEAIRRYRLPFGIAGKFNSYKKSRHLTFSEQARSLVLQDFRVLTQPEYIFGLSPGDLVSFTVDIHDFRPEYSSQIELLLTTFQPSFVIVVATKALGAAPEVLKGFTSAVTEEVDLVPRKLIQAPCVVKACLIDELSRDVTFMNERSAAI